MSLMNRPKKNNACKNCGHTNFVIDRYTAAGDLSCLRCGSVQEENRIVSEVQFGETSSGAATVQGSMVGADQARASFGGRQNAMESREQTLMNGKKRIKRIATAMHIPEYIGDSAGEWFRLALAQNFVQGRRSQNVLATCLYVACRKEKTHHMLIDFSSRIQISVYSLGATFLKMVKALCITNLPLADPSLFIQHFAEKLDFKEQCTKVVRDAVKLALSMSNDWIHEGRRPAGIAGACVLLAARMNNFRRTHAEIVAVAHVGSETLQRRLNEFKKTGSGKLTVASFRDSEGTEEANPPSFDKNRRLEQKLKEEMKAKEEFMLKIHSFAEGVKSTPFEEFKKSYGEAKEQTLFTGDEEELDKAARNIIDDYIKTLDPTEPSQVEETPKKKRRIVDRNEDDRLIALKKILIGSDISVDEISEELERIINRKKCHLEGSLYVTPSESQDVIELKERIELDRPRNLTKNLPKSEDLLSKVSSEIDLNSDDDDEIVLDSELTEAEVKFKERIWTGLNHDFLIAQEKKKLKQEADELTGNTSGSTTRKKRARQDGPKIVDTGVSDELATIGVDADGEPLSAADSAKMVLQKKSFSKKINYATLSDLFNTQA